MEVLLLRHGDAVSPQVDSSRPLSERGRLQAERVAQVLRAEGRQVTAIVHSPKTRAAQTAAIVAPIVAPNAAVRVQDGLLPNDPVEPWGMELEGAAESIMLVGHLPFLPSLAFHLLGPGLGARVPQLEPACVLTLTREKPGSWRLIDLLTPTSTR